ncbi:MAG: 6-phospho-beta-glucosidase, partial [Caldilineae bacterium]
MKITVIGGGSSYTPELINGFLQRCHDLPLRELWLMDIDPHRLQIVGQFAGRMVAAQGAPFAVHLSTDQQQAIAGADYVITQLRVGGMAARREDEYLGHRHGLIGQETTGVGGMAKALRTIPVILQVAQDIRRLAPSALLINFTNPAGLITEALSRHVPEVQSVGVCNIPINTKLEILDRLASRRGEVIDAERATLDTLGLNHLSWHRGFRLDGEDVWPQVFAAYVEEMRQAQDPEWDVDTLLALGMIPNDYLQYYYYTERKLAAQASWPPSRAEQVMAIEKSLLDYYADPAHSRPPEALSRRGGAHYSLVATQLIYAHYHDLGEIHVLNVPHRGAVAEWPPDWVLELPCRVHRSG